MIRWPRKPLAPLALLACTVVWTACGEGVRSPVEPATDVAPAFAVGGVSGAAFTTFNAAADGAGKDVCKNTAINCNIYGAKEYVWLNGGPAANGLGPDGAYFFAVLEPGGQPDPNDGGAKNLSDDYDTYGDRTFTVLDGEVGAYSGPHDLDSGTQGGPKVDGSPPFIRLFPYADTSNPGGVYILAICSLADGYPVRPSDCKYDAFKVREGKIDYSFYLKGRKAWDLQFDGYDDDDPGLPSWKIIVSGTAPDGSAIYIELYTGEGGHWEWYSPVYTFTGSAKPQDVSLTVCEELQAGWQQTYPGGDGCHTLVFTPSGFDSFMELNFANAIFEGCTPGFWQGGPDKPDAKAGGALLWDGVDFVPPLDNPALPPPHVDAQWSDRGGADGNPYIHETDFNAFFGGGAPGSYTMFELVDTGGGSEAWRKAARSLVAAYLNAAWGMAYAYTTAELTAMWSAAVGDDAALLALHTELDAANNAYGRDFGGPRCPISAGGF